MYILDTANVVAEGGQRDPYPVTPTPRGSGRSRLVCEPFALSVTLIHRQGDGGTLIFADALHELCTAGAAVSDFLSRCSTYA